MKSAAKTANATGEYRDDTEYQRSRPERLSAMEKDHFWFVGRRLLLEGMLRSNLGGCRGSVADLGCGTGSNARFLTELGFNAIGMDLDIQPSISRQFLEASPIIQGNVLSLPLRDSSVDGILLLDVLEHLDDRNALREARRALRPGGWALITVPAFPGLWSRRDQASGHLRRYTRRGLAALLHESGFEMRNLQYYQFFLFPALLAGRIFARKKSSLMAIEDNPPRACNTVLTWIVRLELRLGRVIRWPWGSSMVVFCRKPFI